MKELSVMVGFLMVAMFVCVCGFAPAQADDIASTSVFLKSGQGWFEQGFFSDMEMFVIWNKPISEENKIGIVCATVLAGTTEVEADSNQIPSFSQELLISRLLSFSGKQVKFSGKFRDEKLGRTTRTICLQLKLKILPSPEEFEESMERLKTREGYKPEIGPTGDVLFLYKIPPPLGFEEESPYTWPVGDKTLFIGISMDSLKNISPGQRVSVSVGYSNNEEEHPIYINIWKVNKK